ncbi:hypothetical protein TorRG33x02_338260, partial [Trema orientale]
FERNGSRLASTESETAVKGVSSFLSACGSQISPLTSVTHTRSRSRSRSLL